MSKIDTTVGKLVSMIQEGDLRLPEMQRDYVWTATRVRDLLDSLYRGYPSGTILVWEADREMPSRDLAVPQATSAFKGHKLLLDGQQRLTSLSAILRGEPVQVRNRRRPIDILFNLDHPTGPPTEVTEVEDDAPPLEEESERDTEAEEESEAPSIHERLRQKTFVVASKSMAADPRWIRVSDVFSSKSDSQLLKPLVKSFDDPKYDLYSQRLQAVRRIRDYPYVMHVLDKELSYEEVAEIFVRVNSLGVKLRGSDLALAQITSRWKDSLKLFERFQDECEESWFTLDLGLIVRALVVFTTGQSRFKTVSSTPVEKFQGGWEQTKAGIRYAVNFLRSNAGIEDETLLASPAYLITIGYYAMSRNYRMAPEDERDLRRWLYIANARRHYSGSSETTLDSDLNIISKGGTGNDLLISLKQQVGRFEVLSEDFVGRGQRSALFSLAYLALKARGAKDWRTRIRLSLTHSGRYHFIEQHHIFPKAILKKKYGAAEANEIANMAFVSGGTNRNLSAKPPEEYLAKIVSEQGAEALVAHCVPADPRLWTLDAFPEFLAYRREALAAAINDFIAMDEEKRETFNLEQLIQSGESETTEFKSSARWDVREGKPNKVLEQVIVKTIAGFLNGKGGVLIIGVDDDGKIVGLAPDYATLSKRPDRDGYQQFLINLVSSNLGKEICSLLSISFHPVEGGEVCVIYVEQAGAPVYVAEGGTTKFYLRTGNLTQELGTRESVDYSKARFRHP